jgi:hypothetical protein
VQGDLRGEDFGGEGILEKRGEALLEDAKGWRKEMLACVLMSQGNGTRGEFRAYFSQASQSAHLADALLILPGSLKVADSRLSP